MELACRAGRADLNLHVGHRESCQGQQDNRQLQAWQLDSMSSAGGAEHDTRLSFLMTLRRNDEGRRSLAGSAEHQPPKF